MTNIYIRLPISRCQYYRNRDSKHILQPSDPIKFSEYTEEHYVIRSSIYNKVLNTEADSRFFTQQEWRNMMCGKDPTGKFLRLKRDKTEWLKYEEIVKLMGSKPNEKTSLFDYLCIRLPHEVFCVDDVRPTSPTWCIDRFGYNKLVTLINNDFKRSVIEWALATFDYCTSNGRIVLRAPTSMLERYLIRYGIDSTASEKDSLRRVIDRWFNEQHCNFSSYSTFDMTYRDSREQEAPIEGVEWL